MTTPDGTRHGYTYDYRARRVQTSRRNGPLPAQTTNLVFSGGLSLAEYESSTSGAITAHAPTVHYLRGPDMGGGVGGMLYSIRSSTLKYSLSNGRGDIVAQSDESADITWTASYEAFGKRPAETGTNLDKQRANSKDEDPTGLLNEGFRYRDLETGAFISRDPAGFVDGPNLYAYVRQNPWTAFDPEGLYSWDEFTGDVGMWTSGIGNMWKGYSDVTVGAVVGAGAAVADLPKNVADVGSNLWEMSQLDLGTFTEAHVGASQEIAENAVQAASDFGERLAEADERTWGQAVATVLTAGGAKGMQFAKAAPAAELTAGAAKTIGKVQQLADDLTMCFPAGTLVLTKEGLAPIESIKEGKKVLAYDFATREIVVKEVTLTVSHYTYFWVNVGVNGEVIQATRSHRFWVESEQDWIEAINLTKGMTLRKADGDLVTVHSVTIQKLNQPQATYNLEVDETHSYFVGEEQVLVHNGDIERIEPEKILAPPAVRGNAPIGIDNRPLELHHDGQQNNSPLREMTLEEHRGGDNFKKNHQNTGQETSEIDRKEFQKIKRNHWKSEWDTGRFGKGC